MIIYLTYNDQPSGVYWSQVTDVVEHLNTLGGPKVRLVALVSGRGFMETRRAIKGHSPKAMVLPMVPRMKRWRMNTAIVAWVCRLYRPAGMMCRGPFATWIALRMRERGLTKKICFDGRGAYAAEWEEYRIIDDDALVAQFRPLESEAVNKSDFRLAVSNALVAHWRERYGYVGNEHVVVPCTLGSQTPKSTSRGGGPKGRPEQDAIVRLVYSGSTAGWQSFELLEKLLVRVLDEQPNVRVLFLSKRDTHNAALEARYPGRVEVKWLDHAQVPEALIRCDYGIMVREDTITNRVASPTKFAEYLSSGLRIITNDGLGDFSELVRKGGLGLVLEKSGAIPVLTPTSEEERSHVRSIANELFTKGAYAAEYMKLIDRLS